MVSVVYAKECTICRMFFAQCDNIPFAFSLQVSTDGSLSTAFTLSFCSLKLGWRGGENRRERKEKRWKEKQRGRRDRKRGRWLDREKEKMREREK